MAVGSPPPAVDSADYRPATDMPQQEQMDGLPFGTRGGLLVNHFFPQDAEYDIRVSVAGGRSARGLEQFEVTIDGEQVELFTLGTPTPPGHESGTRVSDERTWRCDVSLRESDARRRGPRRGRCRAGVSAVG